MKIRSEKAKPMKFSPTSIKEILNMVFLKAILNVKANVGAKSG